MEKLARVKELIAQLRLEDEAYYVEDNPRISDKQYDALFDELAALERETGVIYAGSPTARVQGKVVDSLRSVRHTKPMHGRLPSTRALLSAGSWMDSLWSSGTRIVCWLR